MQMQCKICGKQLRRGAQKFCSNRCRQEAYRKRREYNAQQITCSMRAIRSWHIIHPVAPTLSCILTKIKYKGETQYLLCYPHNCHTIRLAKQQAVLILKAML